MRIQRTAALLLILALVTSALTACGQQAEPVSGGRLEQTVYTTAFQPEIANAVPLTPDRDRMMATINALCGQPRPIGSDAEYQAALYLQGRMAEYGYTGELQRFSYSLSETDQSERYRQVKDETGEAFFHKVIPARAEGASQNVISSRALEDSGKKVLILSAHYDSTADSIGVVDNAAGVAVVLEAARILAREDLPFELRLAFFGGEESILIGSRNYLLTLDQAERSRILGNITVDTVAYKTQGDFVALTAHTLVREDAQTLKQASPVAAAFLADTRIKPEYDSPLVGDHLAFGAVGIDSVCFGQSMVAVRGTINSSADTYDFLAPELLPTAAQMLVDAVLVLAEQQA